MMRKRQAPAWAQGGDYYEEPPHKRLKGQSDGKGAGKLAPKGRSFGIKIWNVPLSYTHDTILELHEACDVPTEAVESSKFQDPGERDAPGTTTVIVRYGDKYNAERACRELSGQQVADENEQVHTLSTMKFDGPVVNEVFPSVYVSDVPVEFRETEIKELHEQLGMDLEKLKAVKILPSKDPTKETTCCICRYEDDESAEQAIASLKGFQVPTRSGNSRFLGARHAKPATWMVQTGIADKQMKAYHQSQKSPTNQWKHVTPPTGHSLPAVLSAPRVEETAFEVGVPKQGVLTEWSTEEGSGYITPAGIPYGKLKIFVEKSQFIDGGDPNPGLVLSFQAAWDEQKKRHFAEVVMLGDLCETGFGTAEEAADAVAATEEAVVPASVAARLVGGRSLPVGVMLKATIKSWDELRGFGFIECGDGPDVFFHARLLPEPRPPVEVRADIKFRVMWLPDRKRYEADYVLPYPLHASLPILNESMPTGNEWWAGNSGKGGKAGKGGEVDPLQLEIKGFPADLTEDDLLDLFSQHGEIKMVKIVEPGKAIMRMGNPRSAQSAIAGFHQLKLEGAVTPLDVKLAKKQTGTTNAQALARRAPPPPQGGPPSGVMSALEPFLQGPQGEYLRPLLMQLGAETLLEQISSGAIPAWA